MKPHQNKNTDFVLASEGTGIKKRSSLFYFREKWMVTHVICDSIEVFNAVFHNLFVTATAVTEDDDEAKAVLRAKILKEKALMNKAKLNVLQEWLFNADLGHLRQK